MFAPQQTARHTTGAQPPRAMRANRKVIETRCTTCGGAFTLGEEVQACSSCEGFHHAECWNKAGGCATLQEPTVVPAVPPIVPPIVPAEELPVSSPPAALPDDSRRCPSCAEVIKKEALKCRFCGHVLDSRIEERKLPSPPGVPWWVDLMLTIVTFSLFGLVMIAWQCLWARKVNPGSRAGLYFVSCVALSFMSGAVGGTPETAGLAGLFNIASVVLFQCANFSLKHTIEEHFHPRVTLGGVATFFLSHIYFQYHFNRLKD